MHSILKPLRHRPCRLSVHWSSAKLPKCASAISVRGYVLPVSKGRETSEQQKFPRTWSAADCRVQVVEGNCSAGRGHWRLNLLHKDVAAIIEHWVNLFRVDPQNHYINLLLEKLSIVDDRRLKELNIGTFVYSAIFFTEGIGLSLRKRWAEY